MEAPLLNNATSERPESFLDSILRTEVNLDRYQIAILGISLVATYYILDSIRHALFDIKAPVVGYKHFWEPRFILGVKFARNSLPVVRDGYAQFKNSLFKIRRNDVDVLVIPHEHVDELRDMPEDKISAMDAHMKNIVARYTVSNINLLQTSDLHRRVIQQKLTPSLGALIPPIKDELDYALKAEISDCKDWTPVQVHGLIVNLVARVSARIFVGPGLCRDDEWLKVSIQFTKNVGMTRNMVRILPTFLRPILAPTMKSYWGIYSNLKTAKRMLSPIITERRTLAAEDPNYEKPNDFLQWMIDAARPDEGSLHDLAHRQCMISLAAIQTTAMQCTHFIYDICAYPEYTQTLRDEIIAVLREDGGWKKTTLNKLRRMDSYLKESQRLNPPLVLSFQRVTREALTLKNGTFIPSGTHIAMAPDAILHDAEYLPGGGDPEVFDPFRYSKLRDDPSKPQNANRFQFAMSDNTHLHFGHGKFACPGRFFASNEIKMILSHLLIGYDFKFATQHGRPKNLSYEEAQYPDPSVPVVMKRRTGVEKDIAALVGLTA